jgi:hypothetical protein
MVKRISDAEKEDDVALEIGRAVIEAMRMASQDYGGADIEICPTDGTAFHVLVRRCSEDVTRIENCRLPESVWGEEDGKG